jgi:hypothetical protein
VQEELDTRVTFRTINGANTLQIGVLLAYVADTVIS